MRVVRLFRLMKLFKHVEVHGDNRSGAVRPSRLSIVSPPVQQSRVGQKLSELTTRRVVLGVLAMVFVLPYWEVANGVYGESPTFDEQGLVLLHNQALLDSSGSVFLQALKARPHMFLCRVCCGSAGPAILFYLSRLSAFAKMACQSDDIPVHVHVIACLCQLI